MPDFSTSVMNEFSLLLVYIVESWLRFNNRAFVEKRTCLSAPPILIHLI